MRSPEEPRSELSLGFELSVRVRGAPDQDAALAILLDAARRLTHADRGYLAEKNSRGEVALTRRTAAEPASPDEERACLAVARRALLEGEEEHDAHPEDVGTGPLAVMARGLPGRERAIVVVRFATQPFDRDERARFCRVADHGASGLARRTWLAPRAAGPGEAARARPARARKASPEALEARTRRLSAREMTLVSERCPELVGESAAHHKLLEDLARFAPTDLPVLIQGEAGTGKALVAAAIHRLGRREGKYCPVDMGGLSPALGEADLVEHFRGAVGGTVFLGGVGESGLEQQSTLLAGLGGDFRVLAGTRSSLGRLVLEGEFREELLERLQGVEIRLVPLRERREDIRPLVGGMLRALGKGEVREVAGEAWGLLEAHPWPGNVQQLRRAIERAWAVGHTPIRAEDLGLDLAAPGSVAEEDPVGRVARFKKVYEGCRRNLSRAATLLGHDRSTVAWVLGLWAPR